MAKNSKNESGHGMVEASARELKRISAVGFFALVGASIIYPPLSESAAVFGLMWLGFDYAQRSSKKKQEL